MLINTEKNDRHKKSESTQKVTAQQGGFAEKVNPQK